MNNAHGTQLAADHRGHAARPTFTKARITFLLLAFPFTAGFVQSGIWLTTGGGEALLMWASGLIDTITPW